MNNIYDSIIIGAGISGMTSAIYLKRYNLNVLLIEKEIPGGQISKASLIENYPGIKKTDGVTFSTNLLNQIENLGLKINYEEVKEITEENDIKIVKTNNNEYKTKTIIIATGRRPKPLNIGEEKYIGKGVSYCATCDGMFYKDKEVIVVGGGNSALEESLYLSDICKKVTILNRSNELKADKILIDKVKERKNIEILYNEEIKVLLEKEEKIIGVKTTNKEINAEGIFIYVGLLPNTEIFKNIEQENGYILVNSNQETNIKRIYAIGDVTKKSLYQLVTAASDGAIAANHIKNNIEV